MTINETQALELINKIIEKQAVILGPKIATSKAENIKGLGFSKTGTAIKITGNPKQVITDLVDSYVHLSGEIIRNSINVLMANFPDIKHSLE